VERKTCQNAALGKSFGVSKACKRFMIPNASLGLDELVCQKRHICDTAVSAIVHLGISHEVLYQIYQTRGESGRAVVCRVSADGKVKKRVRPGTPCPEEIGPTSRTPTPFRPNVEGNWGQASSVTQRIFLRLLLRPIYCTLSLRYRSPRVVVLNIIRLHPHASRITAQSPRPQSTMPSTPGERHDETSAISSSSISVHTQHATCPPEETREQHAPREERTLTEPRVEPMLNATSAQPSTPTAETGSASVDEMDTGDIEKRIEDVDEGLRSPTILLTDSPRDSDTRLAQSMSEAALSPVLPHAWPAEREDTQRVRKQITVS